MTIFDKVTLVFVLVVLCRFVFFFFANSEDICNSEIKMCPLCDNWCDYWDLKETCVHARITYLFDNPTTVFFAIFMSFWGKNSLQEVVEVIKRIMIKI